MTPDDLVRKIRDSYKNDNTKFNLDKVDPRFIGFAQERWDCTYKWYYNVGKVLAPKRILEIGVLFGVSGYALICGAAFGNKSKPPSYTGYDAEVYFKGANDAAAKLLHAAQKKAVVIHANTQQLSSLNETADLVHVDGGHEEAEAYHDMNLAWEALVNGGVMLVDDMSHPKVLSAMGRWLRENQQTVAVIPTMQSLGLILKEPSKKGLRRELE